MLRQLRQRGMGKMPGALRLRRGHGKMETMWLQDRLGGWVARKGASCRRFRMGNRALGRRSKGPYHGICFCVLTMP